MLTKNEIENALLDKRDVLSDERLKRLAPSIYSETARSDKSQHYHFIPTAEVLRIFEKEGWLPVKAMEQNVRIKERRGFQRHCIRLRNFKEKLIVGDSAVEIVLVNSHDGTCAYQLHVGLFRLVCSNGLIVADSLFNTARIRHQGHQEKDFIDVSYRVIEDVPKLSYEVSEFQSIELNEAEQTAFSKSALLLRWEEDKAPISPTALLKRRHVEDANRNDLYTTFNAVQQNLIQGRILGRNSSGRLTRTRAVKSIREDLRLNKALWTMASELKKLKLAV